MFNSLPQELLGVINGYLPCDKDKHSFMYTCKATRYADSILAQLAGIYLDVSGSAEDAASQILGFPIECPKGADGSLEIRVSGCNPSAFTEMCWMEHRWSEEIEDVLECVSYLIFNMEVPFEADDSPSLAQAIQNAFPLLDVLHLDFRSCHVPSLLEALADEGQELGWLVVNNKGCQCEGCQEACVEMLQESLPQIIRFPSLRWLELEPVLVEDVSELLLPNLELLSLPLSSELHGLNTLLASAPHLSDLSLQSLPYPINSRSITILMLFCLDPQSIEHLLRSSLPCLKELKVVRLCLDDPHYLGYGKARNFPLVWDRNLCLHGDHLLSCSSYHKVVKDVVPFPGGIVGLQVCDMTHVCASDVEQLVAVLKPQGLRKIMFRRCIHLDVTCMDRARQMVEEVELT